MERLVVFGAKGGCGKTTTSVIFGVGLQLPVCDLDPQQSAANWLSRRQLPHPIVRADADRWVADCSPGINGEHIPVLAKASAVVIPVRASFNDLQELPKTVQFVRANTQGRIGFLLSAIDKRSGDEKMLRSLLGPFGHMIVGMFADRACYRRAGITGQVPGELNAAAAREMQEVINGVRALAK